MERAAKALVKLQDPLGISAVPPEVYRDRFCRRVVDRIILGRKNAENQGSSSSGFSFAPYSVLAGVRGEASSRKAPTNTDKERGGGKLAAAKTASSQLALGKGPSPTLRIK